MATKQQTGIITPEMAKIPDDSLEQKYQTNFTGTSKKTFLQNCSSLLLHIFSFSIIGFGTFCSRYMSNCVFPIIISVIFGLAVACALCTLIRKEIEMRYVSTGLFPACVFVVLVWLLFYNLIEVTWLAAGLFLLVLAMYVLLSIKKQFDKEGGLLTLEFVMYYLITYIRYANF